MTSFGLFSEINYSQIPKPNLLFEEMCAFSSVKNTIKGTKMIPQRKEERHNTMRRISCEYKETT